jgi:hypothetical protein
MTERKIRKSPNESATEYDEGTIMKGNDNRSWVVIKNKLGTKRWVPMESAELNGYRLLTIDYLSKNINKSVIIYEREYGSKWPKKSEKMYKIKIVATGNAILTKNKKNKIFPNWLRTRDPSIKDNTYFSVECYTNLFSGSSQMDLSSMQVDSKNKQSVSNNLMNVEAFVKV